MEHAPSGIPSPSPDNHTAAPFRPPPPTPTHPTPSGPPRPITQSHTHTPPPPPSGLARQSCNKFVAPPALCMDVYTTVPSGSGLRPIPLGSGLRPFPPGSFMLTPTPGRPPGVAPPPPPPLCALSAFFSSLLPACALSLSMCPCLCPPCMQCLVRPHESPLFFRLHEQLTTRRVGAHPPPAVPVHTQVTPCQPLCVLKPSPSAGSLVEVHCLHLRLHRGRGPAALAPQYLRKPSLGHAHPLNPSKHVTHTPGMRAGPSRARPHGTRSHPRFQVPSSLARRAPPAPPPWCPSAHTRSSNLHTRLTVSAYILARARAPPPPAAVGSPLYP